MTNVTKYLFGGLYITTNLAENIAPSGEDRIVEWSYPTRTNEVSKVTRNLLPNSSFEAGLGHGWGFLAEGYDRDYSFSSLWSTNKASHGTASIWFPKNGQFFSRAINLPADRKFTLSAWVRSDAPSGVVLGIGNGITAPEGLPQPPEVSKTFETGNSWTRVSVSAFLPSYPHSLYHVIITGRENMWVDAVQLEEGDATPFRPSADVEVGFTSKVDGNIMFEDETPSLTMLASSASPVGSTNLIFFEIFDIFNKRIESSQRQISVPAGGKYSTTISLPNRRGIFRLVSWVDGAENTVEEVVYSILPRPVSGVGVNSNIGTHPNLTRYQLDGLNRLGIKWLRLMSPEAIFRWSHVEKEPGQIDWYDQKVDLAVSKGFTIMGTIGSNDYWPTWANNNGLPDLDKWESFVERLVTHYKTRIKYWEIWNEPNYTFTPQFYAELLKRAAAAIRRADPEAKIIGMGGAYSSDWILTVMNALGADWKKHLDIIATHIYPPSTDPSGGEAEGRTRDFKRRLIDVYGVELWNTETGVWDMGFRKTANANFVPDGDPLWPYEDSARFISGSYYEAERMMENLLHCLGNGLTKYFYYDSRIFADPTFHRSHPTMMEYDDTVRSKGIAYAIAAYFLDYSQSMGNVSSGYQQGPYVSLQSRRSGHRGSLVQGQSAARCKDRFKCLARLRYDGKRVPSHFG